MSVLYELGKDLRYSQSRYERMFTIVAMCVVIIIIITTIIINFI